jgi:hypothetical protein
LRVRPRDIGQRLFTLVEALQEPGDVSARRYRVGFAVLDGRELGRRLRHSGRARHDKADERDTER